MSSYAERLQRAAMLAGLPHPGWQSDVAQRVGVKPQAIQYLASPANKAKGSSHNAKIAEVLGVSANWLATGEGEPDQGDVGGAAIFRAMMPLLPTDAAVDQWVASNRPLTQADYWLPCPRDAGPRSFIWRVTGTAMQSPFPGTHSYPAGAIVFVDPDREAVAGCRSLVRLASGTHLLRQISDEGGEMWLQPLNPQFPAAPIDADDRIVGTVIGVFVAD